MGWYRLDSSGSEWGLLVGSCEHGNEPSGFVKFWVVFAEFTIQIKRFYGRFNLKILFPRLGRKIQAYYCRTLKTWEARRVGSTIPRPTICLHQARPVHVPGGRELTT
jgi:hypothetical protein